MTKREELRQAEIGLTRLRTVQVDMLGELLTEAWLRTSPKSLARTLLEEG
jgi:hypothetical protein